MTPVVRSINGEWILYPTMPGASRWFVWRWAQKFPEDVRFRENPDVQHKEAR